MTMMQGKVRCRGEGYCTEQRSFDLESRSRLFWARMSGGNCPGIGVSVSMAFSDVPEVDTSLDDLGASTSPIVDN